MTRWGFAHPQQPNATAPRPATEDDPRTFEATDVHLRDFGVYHVPQPEFLYHYDFGDSWLHRVAFEQ